MYGQVDAWGNLGLQVELAELAWAALLNAPPAALAPPQVLSHFPNIAAHCASLGVDITKVGRPAHQAPRR